MSAVKIGTITIDQPKEAMRTYECAAWYTKLILDPGTFDLTMDFSPEMSPYWLFWKQSGTVTGSCFDSLFCGNLIRAKRDEDVGQRQEYHHQLYAYYLCENKLTAGVVKLDPDWQWLTLPHQQWRPHCNRLRVLRDMRSTRIFDIQGVTFDGPMFTVTFKTPDNGVEMVTLSVDDNWHLIQHDCSGDKDLSALYEPGKDIREYYHLWTVFWGWHKAKKAA